MRFCVQCGSKYMFTDTFSQVCRAITCKPSVLGTDGDMSAGIYPHSYPYMYTTELFERALHFAHVANVRGFAQRTLPSWSASMGSATPSDTVLLDTDDDDDQIARDAPFLHPSESWEADIDQLLQRI